MTEIDPDLLQPLVMVLGPDGSLQQFSKGCEAVSGYPASDVLGRSVVDLPCLICEDRERLRADLATAEAVTSPRTRVETWVASTGALRRIRWTETTLPGPDGRPGATVRSGVLEDVSSSQDIQTLATKYRQAVDTFFRLMSHELITPLMPILDIIDELDGGNWPAGESSESISKLAGSWRQLHQVLTNILNFAKLESHLLAVQPFEPWSLAMKVLKLQAETAREKGIRLELRAIGPIPSRIETDKERMREILQHLVQNAIKFSNRGTVTVEVGPSSILDSAGRESAGLRFVVRDQGIGMTREQLQELGQPFFQVDPSASRLRGGSGLGLAITRRLAQQIRSRFEAESTPGVGTAFMVTVPIGDAASESADASQLPPFVIEPSLSNGIPAMGLHGHVMLAEDSRDNQIVVGHILEKMGLSYEVAENGEVALERLAEREFDLILMDMQMPVLDGYTATRILRERGCTLPIIALTAHVMVGDEDRCLEAGCTDYLPKPIDRTRFRNTLARYLAPNLSGNGAATLTPAPASPPCPEAVSPLRSQYESDRKFLEIVRDYVTGLPDQLNNLSEALRAADRVQATRIAHKLRGSGGMYGYPDFSAVAGELEDEANRGEPFDRLDRHARRLDGLCERMRRGLPSEAEPAPREVQMADVLA